MSYYLWLDDYRPKPTPSIHQWVVARDIDAFKQVIEKLGMPKYISFDHDLTEAHYKKDYSDHRTGMDCIEWLLEFAKANNLGAPANWGVHTMNKDMFVPMCKILETAWPSKYKTWQDVA
jgi:hypothetical protein